jgi:hypothetical protein
MTRQDMVLGNFTWSSFAIILVATYLLLNILWFSFKSKKHFLIGAIAFIVLIGAYSAIR